jgi:hypothetical protein
MDKIKIHEFNPVIYPVKIWVVVNPKRGQIIENFKYLDGKNIEIESDMKNIVACVFDKPLIRSRTGKYGFLIVINEKLHVGEIAHESCHAVGSIYNYLGVKFSTIEDEPNAYLTGWVASCIDNVNKLID